VNQVTLMLATTLVEQVRDAANLLGLLLALDTLFTTEQARRLSEQRAREGGARRSVLRGVRLMAIGLAVLTAGSVAILAPLMVGVLGAIGGDDWEPVLGVFALTYLLLAGLLVWQIQLMVRAHRTEEALEDAE
jgi:hypothetical protein